MHYQVKELLELNNNSAPFRGITSFCWAWTEYDADYLRKSLEKVNRGCASI